MRYTVIHNDQNHALELGAASDGPRTFLLNGESHSVEVVYLPNGVVSLLVDGRSYDVDFERPAGAQDVLDPRVNVRVRGEVFQLAVMDERQARLQAAAHRGAHHDGPHNILSPMPGKVVKLLKEVGATVKAGEGVVVVEAMKMENELKSAGPGVIAEIKCKEGQPVEAGTVLVVVGPLV